MPRREISDENKMMCSINVEYCDAKRYVVVWNPNENLVVHLARVNKLI